MARSTLYEPTGRSDGLAMSCSSPEPPVSSNAAGAPLAGSGVPCCPGCGGPLTGRKRACSGRCRATLSRQRATARQSARDAELRRLLEVALRMLTAETPP
jgi:hypothetical protein